MAATTTTQRDDRVLPAMHWASLAIVAILIPALVILWGLPSRTADFWAWSFMIACFTVQVGLGALLLSLDPRWSSWRLLLQTVLVAVSLLTLGTIRSWSDFDSSDAATWLFVGGLAGLTLAILVLYRSVSREDRQPTQVRVSGSALPGQHSPPAEQEV